MKKIFLVLIILLFSESATYAINLSDALLKAFFK